MTSDEFIRRVCAARDELDSDWLAWRVEEIVDEYRGDEGDH